MNHLTVIGSFSSVADRATPTNIRWWLRTPQNATLAWGVNTTGVWLNTIHGHSDNGVRPALIIHQ